MCLCMDEHITLEFARGSRSLLTVKLDIDYESRAVHGSNFSSIQSSF